jgi:hypothetical protein
MADWSAAGNNAAAAGVTAAGVWISLHTAAPGTNGTAEIASGANRVATTWGSPTNGVASGSQVNINVPASTTVTYFGVWSAQNSGTYLYGAALPTSETYGGAGVYELTPTVNAAGTS